MSFSYSNIARSKTDARQHLEKYAGQLPAPVREFVATAIENIGPVSGYELRAIKVSANGHLTEKSAPGSYSTSSADIRVEPIFALE